MRLRPLLAAPALALCALLALAAAPAPADPAPWQPDVEAVYAPMPEVDYEAVAQLAAAHDAEVAAAAEAQRLADEEAARAAAAKRRAAPAAQPGTAVNYSSMEPCGGDLPPCWVKARESGGDYGAVNWTGCSGRTCGGAWQFDPRTWNGYGGYAFAQDAPPAVQDAKARLTWAGGAGCSHWAACR